MTRARIAVVVTIVMCGLLAPVAPALSAPPSNDVFAGAVEIDPGALPFTDSRDTTEATTDADDVEVNVACGNGPPVTDATVWYSITPTSATNVLARTAGTNYTAGILVATGSPGSFESVACGPRGITFPVEVGVTYYLLVIDDQEDGEGNGGQLELQVDVADHVCGPPGAEEAATIVGAGTIRGTASDDVILGSANRDRIFGLGGNDLICGEGGNDLILGGDGDDLLIGDGQDLPPFAPSNGDNNDTILGGNGNDTLVGLGGDDNLRGGRGDDTLLGMGGNDNMRGDLGDDELFGGPLDDFMRGGAGDDTMFGNFGSDVLLGESGNDLLDGDNPFPERPIETVPFPPGGNEDRCNGGPGTDEIVNCELGNMTTP